MNYCRLINLVHAFIRGDRPMAQGVCDALDILIAWGKLSGEDDVELVVVAGDGSTYDMALSAASGAIFRGLDFWSFCYDKESYGNTGMQIERHSLWRPHANDACHHPDEGWN